MTRLNAELNGAEVDVRDGSFFEPVAGERFDLIATNPPFVISPATGERLVYRDSGLPGDRVVEHIVRTGPDHLADGGWLQVLANWSIVEGRPWDERLGSWLRDDCDALVVQRETLDPSAYVELWLKDTGHHGGPDYARRYDTWLSWFEEQGIEGVGFGWINVRLGGAAPRAPRVAVRRRAAHRPGDPRLGRGGHRPARPQRRRAARPTLVARDDVQQETVGRPGAEDPEAIVLRQQRGFRRARTADTVEAAFLGACDGDLTVGRSSPPSRSCSSATTAELRTTYLPVVRELVGEGFLELDAGQWCWRRRAACRAVRERSVPVVHDVSAPPCSPTRRSHRDRRRERRRGLRRRRSLGPPSRPAWPSTRCATALSDAVRGRRRPHRRRVLAATARRPADDPDDPAASRSGVMPLGRAQAAACATSRRHSRSGAARSAGSSGSRRSVSSSSATEPRLVGASGRGGRRAADSVAGEASSPAARRVLPATATSQRERPARAGAGGGGLGTTRGTATSAWRCATSPCAPVSTSLHEVDQSAVDEDEVADPAAIARSCARHAPERSP